VQISKHHVLQHRGQKRSKFSKRQFSDLTEQAFYYVTHFKASAVEALIQNLVLRIGHGRNAILEKRSIQKMEMVFGCYVVIFTLSGLSMNIFFFVF